MEVRLEGTISGGGKSAIAVIPSVGSGRYTPGPTMVVSSLIMLGTALYDKCPTGAIPKPGSSTTVSITASFTRVLQRCAGHLCMHFLAIFQELRRVSKTCNQFNGRGDRRQASPSEPFTVTTTQPQVARPVIWSLGSGGL